MHPNDDTNPPAHPPRTDRRTLTDWRPADAAFWERTGRRVAWRNLWISIPALFVAFAVWMLPSVVVVMLTPAGFRFSEAQLFWLAALPALSGATLRLVYALMVPVFGGRTWTALSTAALLLPAIGIGVAVQDPRTPFWAFALLALSCGLGGGSFASSTANINFFFPPASKGTALGLNAGLGNLGVSAMQWLVPVVVATAAFHGLVGPSQATADGGEIWLQNAGFVWVPVIVTVALAAWFGMHDLAVARAPAAERSAAFRSRHGWLTSWLYLGTFGSFIGFAAALPRLIETQFPAVDPLRFAFVGPLVGAAVRPLGGWVADRLGGARVTLWSFVVLAVAAAGVLLVLRGGGGAEAFPAFLAMFLLLFAAAGIGNGSTFRMIPAVFLGLRTRGLRDAGEIEAARRAAERESGAALGLTSAIGAYGGFVVPLAFGYSIARTGSAEVALWAGIAFYLSCIGISWWCYLRTGADAAG